MDARDVERCMRNILYMVAELHARGRQRVRIRPGMAPSGLYWRCHVSADPSGSGARWNSGEGNSAFGVDGAAAWSPDRLADLLVERFPHIVTKGAGNDPAYVEWFAEVLRLADAGWFPIFYADWQFDGVELVSPQGHRQAPHLRPPPEP